MPPQKAPTFPTIVQARPLLEAITAPERLTLEVFERRARHAARAGGRAPATTHHPPPHSDWAHRELRGAGPARPQPRIMAGASGSLMPTAVLIQCPSFCRSSLSRYCSLFELADQLKPGSITQSERLAKYNRLLATEAETGWPVVRWPVGGAPR